MSAEGSDAKEKLTEMEEDPKKTGQWWEEKPDLEDRTKKEVKQWLDYFKEKHDLDFEVKNVACSGELLAARTEAQLEKYAGGIAGADIFNAKEKLRKKETSQDLRKRRQREMTYSNEGIEYKGGQLYVEALLKAESNATLMGDPKVSKFLPMKVYTLEDPEVPIPGFIELAREEHKRMLSRNSPGFRILRRQCFAQVTKHFRAIREEYIEIYRGRAHADPIRHVILVGHSGIGKSLSFSQEYQVQAFIKREKVAFYSVPEGRVYLYIPQIEGSYICQRVDVSGDTFWASKTWRDFDGIDAHLIIDPRRGKGPGFYKPVEVIAFVVYLTSPNAELKTFQETIGDVNSKEVCVKRFDVEEMKVVAKALSLDFKEIERRMERTAGQLRPVVSEARYKKFEERQEDAWRRTSKENPAEMIHIGDLRVSSKIFALEAVLEEGDGEAELFSEKKVVVPQSAWVLSKLYENHHQSVITDLKGLEAEKWFFMELHEGCELKGRPLPKNVAKGMGLQERKHTFSKKNKMITYSSGTKANQEKFKKDVSESKNGDAFFICPKGFPAIDGASDKRKLFQATIAGSKTVKKATITLLRHFGASKECKADVYYVVPHRFYETFSISFQGGVDGAVGKAALDMANFWVVGIDVVKSIKRHWDERLGD